MSPRPYAVRPARTFASKSTVSTCPACRAANMLAWRRRAAADLGTGDHQGPPCAPEPQHLPPAAHRPQHADHALADAPRRRWTSANTPRPIPASPSPSRWPLARDPATPSGRGHAGDRYAVGIPVRQACCADRAPKSRKALGSELSVPAYAEIVLEGHLLPTTDPRALTPSVPTASLRWIPAMKWPGRSLRRPTPAGHNERDWFPVFLPWTASRCAAIPIYHSTYTGKPPDEPAVLGVALNEVFIPLLRRRQPEIVDFYLPPRAAATAWRWSPSANSTPATPSGC